MSFPPLDDNVDPYNSSFEDDLLGRASFGNALSRVIDHKERLSENSTPTSLAS